MHEWFSIPRPSVFQAFKHDDLSTLSKYHNRQAAAMNWRVLPYMGYVGMCGRKGYGFSAVLVINRVSIFVLQSSRTTPRHKQCKLFFKTKRSFYFHNESSLLTLNPLVSGKNQLVQLSAMHTGIQVIFSPLGQVAVWAFASCTKDGPQCVLIEVFGSCRTWRNNKIHFRQRFGSFQLSSTSHCIMIS